MAALDTKVQEQFGLLGSDLLESYKFVTIPVVVHVLYNPAAGNKPAVGNISDAQIASQINVLNRDYGPAAQDRNRSIVPVRFRDRFGFPKIQFILAEVERVSTQAKVFSNADNAKKKPDGTPPRDRDRYLNIWVVPRLVNENNEEIMGYSSWPGEDAKTDGVVIRHLYFGTSGTATAPFNLGHTTAHEIGHWLNLHHLWGDYIDNPNCTRDDFVDDTPKQDGATQGCPAAATKAPACDDNVDGAMFPNYMDYTQDACMSMFSTQQVIRMRTTLEKFRSGFAGVK
jgi:hypothetical protein